MKNVYILASGPSMLDLSQKEKNLINNSETICVNRYLCFWDMVNIYPKNWIYVDDDCKTPHILKESVRKYKNYKINAFSIQKHIDFLKLQESTKWNFFTLNNKYSYQSFAEKLEDKLFWLSIVGMAINLSYIIYPDRDIKIVGMDGGNINHFWIKDMIENPKNYNQDSKKNLDFSTKNEHNSVEWWRKSYGTVNRFFANKNISVFNCNMNSTYVKEGIMKYLPII